MAEGTEPIRQDIDGIRDSMTETLGQIESRVRGNVDSTVDHVREVFDLKKQVNEHPWTAIGLALAAGYLVGSMGSEEPHGYRSHPGQPTRYYPEQGFRADMPAPGYAATGSSQSYSPGSAGATNYSSGNAGSSASSGFSASHHADGNFSYDAVRNQSNGIGSQVGGMMSRVAAPVSDELSVLAMAAVRSAMRMLRESLQESIPQFGDEYQHVRSERGDAYGMASGEQPRPTGSDQTDHERSIGASYGSPLGSTTDSSRSYEGTTTSAGSESADYDRSRSSTISGRADL